MKSPSGITLRLKKVKKFKVPKLPTYVGDVQGSLVTEEQIRVDPSSSAADIEPVHEPVLIRLSKKFGGLGGAALGAITGSRVGFGKEGASFGQKYGSHLAEFGAKQLLKAFPILGSLKKGGKIHKTGAYLLHKGEIVVPLKMKPRKKVK